MGIGVLVCCNSSVLSMTFIEMVLWGVNEINKMEGSKKVINSYFEAADEEFEAQPDPRCMVQNSGLAGQSGPNFPKFSARARFLGQNQASQKRNHAEHRWTKNN